MTKLVLEKLNKSNVNVINCREQPYNNASNMSGTYKGMQAEIKKTQRKYAGYCPCAAHLLNLVEGQSPLSVLNLLICFRLSMNFIFHCTKNEVFH